MPADRMTYSLAEAARMLGLGKHVMSEAVKKGQIPTIRMGTRLRVPAPALLERLAASGDDSEKGRVERGLEADLRPDMGSAEQAALRAQARAVDAAERASDSDAVSRANSVYLALREAAGLTSGGTKPVDAFDELLKSLGTPTPGVSDTAND